MDKADTSSEDKKSISEWERQLDVLFTPKLASQKKITQEEFQELVQSEPNIGIDYETREKWLKDNDHKVTRKNLADPTLAPLAPSE